MLHCIRVATVKTAIVEVMPLDIYWYQYTCFFYLTLTRRIFIWTINEILTKAIFNFLIYQFCWTIIIHCSPIISLSPQVMNIWIPLSFSVSMNRSLRAILYKRDYWDVYRSRVEQNEKEMLGRVSTVLIYSKQNNKSIMWSKVTTAYLFYNLDNIPLLVWIAPLPNRTRVSNTKRHCNLYTHQWHKFSLLKCTTSNVQIHKLLIEALKLDTILRQLTWLKCITYARPLV